MKMTVVLDSKGELVAAQVGAATDRGHEAGLVAGPSQKLHTIDVPDEIVNVSDASQFATRVKPHLPKG
ncbi:MAG: hypothetical protein ACRDG3_09040 [Tepidiformaceae bacterium]